MEALIIRLARENGTWGYDRIAGAMKRLDHEVSDQTVGNVLRRPGMEPAPKRRQSTSWNDFIRAHMEVLAGMDFFTVEVLTWSGLATYYVLFLIHLESRRITIAGITRHPTEKWMEHIAPNVTDESTGCLRNIRYVLHDRDTKFCASFGSISDGSRCRTPEAARTQSESERVRRTLGSLSESGMLVKADPFRRSVFEARTFRVRRPFSWRRPHQGKGNVILFPSQPLKRTVVCRELLGGLLRYYSRAA